MLTHLTAIVGREGSGYVSICPEYDIVSKGSSVEEARENLREALMLFLETTPPDDLRKRFHQWS